MKDFISKLIDSKVLSKIPKSERYAGGIHLDEEGEKYLYVEIDSAYLKDKHEFRNLKWKDGNNKEHNPGNEVLSEISLVEECLIKHSDKLIPLSFKENLSNDKSNYINKLEGKYPYKVLGNFTNKLRKKYKRNDIWIISVKLSDISLPEKLCLDKDGRDRRMHRLIYEVSASSNKDETKDLIFLNCYQHRIHRYRKDFKNYKGHDGHKLDQKTGAFSNPELSEQESQMKAWITGKPRITKF